MWKAKRLEDGTVVIWHETEGGGAEVVCLTDGRIRLYEIPQYGGDLRHIGDYATVCAAMTEALLWT